MDISIFPKRTLIVLVLLGGCATEKEIYEGWENSRVQNCHQQYGPYDPELEYCIERATVPYDDIEADRKEPD